MGCFNLFQHVPFPGDGEVHAENFCIYLSTSSLLKIKLLFLIEIFFTNAIQVLKIRSII